MRSRQECARDRLLETFLARRSTRRICRHDSTVVHGCCGCWSCSETYHSLTQPYSHRYTLSTTLTSPVRYNSLSHSPRIPRVKNRLGRVDISRPHRARRKAARATTIPTMVNRLQRARIYRRVWARPSHALRRVALKGDRTILAAIAPIPPPP